jgi:hypothetical protein
MQWLLEEQLLLLCHADTRVLCTWPFSSTITLLVAPPNFKACRVVIVKMWKCSVRHCSGKESRISKAYKLDGILPAQQRHPWKSFALTTRKKPGSSPRKHEVRSEADLFSSLAIALAASSQRPLHTLAKAKFVNCIIRRQVESIRLWILTSILLHF